MTLPEVINANRGRPASVTGPGGRIFPVGMGGGGPPITTPLAPVSPQLPQIPSFMPGSNPGMGGLNPGSPASYLNPYHPDPHGFNLYGNNTPGEQPLGSGVVNGLQNMQSQFGKLPSQPRTYGA